MTEPTVLFAARRMPPRGGGGLERLSADTLGVLRGAFRVRDLAHRGPLVGELPYLATLAGRLRREAARHRAPVADGSDASLAPALAAARVPSLCRVVGLDIVHRNRFYRRMVHAALPRLPGIVAISRATAALLPPSVQADRVHIVHPFAEAPRGFKHDPQDGRVLMVGRLVPRKGIAEFVRDVWPLVVARRGDATLDLVGDGPQRGALKQALRRGSATSSVRWHGRADQAELERLYAHAAVLAMNNRSLPGDFEGFGMVAVEAAARGVPVVARAVDGIPDAVAHDRTGFLVQDADAQAMADAVVHALDRKGPSPATVRAEAKARYGRERYAHEYAALIRSATV